MSDINALISALQKVQVANIEQLEVPIQAKRLAAAFRLFQDRRVCPFGPGDFVTPRRDGMVTGHGKPHIVLEVDDAAELMFPAHEPFAFSYGRRPQMRVALMSGEDVANFWTEAWEFERWTGSVAA